MKKIAVAITNRTNYSKLKKVLFELNEHEEVEIFIVASSTVLLKRYGKALDDLESDGWEISKRIDCTLLNDSHEAMAKTVGISIIEHASFFADIKPDIILIVGDRFDMLAPVVASSLMNIPIAHIQGGELSGTIDNVIRDVFTNFSTLHFVATEKSANSLKRFGIREEQILNFGCPAVEYISEIEVGDHFDRNSLRKNFKHPIEIGPNEPYFLVMVHPDTTNKQDVDMDRLLNILEKFDRKALIFYPNVDANNSDIVSGIASHNKNPNFYMIRHIPLEGFVHVMAHASFMIGNSSAGIREAASFGVPVINIGYRQANRERNENVIDIGEDYNLLEKTIREMDGHKFEKHNIYLKPDCSKSIAEYVLKYLDSSL